MHARSISLFGITAATLCSAAFSRPQDSPSVQDATQELLRRGDAVTSSKGFRDEVQTLVRTIGSRSHPYVFIENGGAAWRGETVITTQPFTVRGTVPERLENLSCRYIYLGLEQKVYQSTRGVWHRSDIGLAMNYQVERAMPFITTKDPSLNPSRAQVLVWRTTPSGPELVTNSGTLLGKKYYTIDKNCSLYSEATFAPNETVSVSLQAVPKDSKESMLVLTLKSEERTVVVRIPRINRYIKDKNSIKVHKVTSATVASSEKNANSVDLLVASTEALPPSELSSFPELHRTYVRALMAEKQDAGGEESGR